MDYEGRKAIFRIMCEHADQFRTRSKNFYKTWPKRKYTEYDRFSPQLNLIQESGILDEDWCYSLDVAFGDLIQCPSEDRKEINRFRRRFLKMCYTALKLDKQHD